MTVSISNNFDYDAKCWGSAPITNFYTDFQGLELYYLLQDATPFLPKTASILDLGCGGGNICGFLKQKFPSWKITGIDISEEAIIAAKQKFPKIEFLQSSAEHIKKTNNSFDMITSFDTLEHFEKLDKVLNEVNRLLKPGGVFCIGVPLEREFPTIYWMLYQLGWRGKKHFSGHVNFFTDKTLEKKVTNHGFQLEKKRYSFHPIFSLFDIGYYVLQSISGKQFAFETTVSRMKPSPEKSLLSSFKNSIAALGYFESRIFWYIPGGKGHFVFIKSKQESQNEK